MLFLVWCFLLLATTLLATVYPSYFSQYTVQQNMKSISGQKLIPSETLGLVSPFMQYVNFILINLALENTHIKLN